MKLIFLFLLFSSSLFAVEGVVKVLEAPLYKEENFNSKIVQHVRKGAKIYIHESATRSEDYVQVDTVFNQNNEDEEIKIPERKNISDFYATLDNQGQVVFIQKKFVDITYLDEREFNQKNLAIDPTDYRLAEPLPKEYPLYSLEGFKTVVFLGMGPHPKNNYEYNSRIKDESYSNNIDLGAAFASKADFDFKNRLYFGGAVRYSKKSAQFSLENRTAEEAEMKIGIGPYLSYDPFVSEHYKLSVFSSILFNFVNSHTVSQREDSGKSETLIFSGTSFSPQIGIFLTLPELVEDIEFIIGGASQFEYPRKLISRTAPTYTGYWNTPTTNGETSNAFIQSTMFIGIQKVF